MRALPFFPEVENNHRYDRDDSNPKHIPCRCCETIHQFTPLFASPKRPNKIAQINNIIVTTELPIINGNCVTPEAHGPIIPAVVATIARFLQ